MKKHFTFLAAAVMLVLSSLCTAAQDKTMTWTTKSSEARDIALQGAQHWKNNEITQAYQKFQQATEMDPDFSVALAFMASFSKGAAKASYTERAKKSVADKTDGEKMFISLLDAKGKDFTDKVAKLHEMFPDGTMLATLYINNLAKPEEQLQAAEDYMKKFPDDAAIYNTVGYLYMQVKKDTAGAKPFFEKYMKMYPDGPNPYDSMGEYYFDLGDMTNAEKYYGLALEKYPFFQSSIDKLTEIKKMKDKK